MAAVLLLFTCTPVLVVLQMLLCAQHAVALVLHVQDLHGPTCSRKLLRNYTILDWGL
jgi:hypothetical protein